MHIVLVNQWYPPDSQYGGIAMHNYNIARSYVGFGHKVTVICGKRLSDLPPKIEREGVQIVRLPQPSAYHLRRLLLIGHWVRPFLQLVYSIRVAKTLRHLLSKQYVDIVEFADVNAEGLFWHSQTDVVTVVRCQTPTFVLNRYYTRQEQPYNASLTTWAEKRQIAQADTLIAPTQDMARVISEACGIRLNRFHIIPEALDTNMFRPSNGARSRDMLNILHVGRMERAKGLEILVDVIPRIIAQLPNVRFTFVGKSVPRTDEYGSGADYVTSKLKNFLADGHVRILGPIELSRLITLYQQSDMAVVPSLLYESFSFTCAQAMACGAPVIASAIGGIPETIGNDALLVEPGNAQHLAERILWLAENDERRQQIGCELRERAKNHFGADKVARENLSVFEEQLGLRKKPVPGKVAVA